jgi:hypothetical protein
MFLISYSVCHWQASPAWSNVCGQGQEWSTGLGSLLALPTNNRLGWNGLSGKNALAYYEHSKITSIKRFVTSVGGFLFAKGLTIP